MSGVPKKLYCKLVVRPSASVSTTCAWPMPVMPVGVLSEKGPAGTVPRYCWMPLMYKAMSEGRALVPISAGMGAVLR